MSDKAKEALIHYFRRAINGDGSEPLDADCESEIRSIVDEIIAEAVARVPRSGGTAQ